MDICLEQGADCLHRVQLTPPHHKTPSSLAGFKSRLPLLPSWYRLTEVVLEKRPLNRCSMLFLIPTQHNMAQFHCLSRTNLIG